VLGRCLDELRGGASAGSLAPVTLVPSIDAVRGGEERVREGTHFRRSHHGFSLVGEEPAQTVGIRVRPNRDRLQTDVGDESPSVVAMLNPAVVRPLVHLGFGRQHFRVEGRAIASHGAEEAVNASEEFLEHGGISHCGWWN